jgi:hypothetical protein
MLIGVGNSQLPNCPLPAANCQLPTAYCLLTAYCPHWPIQNKRMLLKDNNLITENYYCQISASELSDTTVLAGEDQRKGLNEKELLV